MVQELETLRARAEFDSRDFDRGARDVVNRLRDMDRQAAGFSRTFDRNLSSFGRSIGGFSSGLASAQAAIFNLRNAAGALAGALAVRETIQYADSWTLANDRIRLATRGHEDLGERMDAVFQIAQDTRTAFAPIADLYGRVERSTRSLGLSTSSLTDITQGLAQTIRISGGNAQEGAAALIQFGQALGSGRLQGDELRSVMENLPTLFDALLEGIQQVAPELGVTRENFRELAADGIISSELLVRAFSTQLPKINQLFGQTTTTISEAATQVDNAIGRLVGTLSGGDVTGAASGLATVLSGLAEVMSSDAFTGQVDEAVSRFRRFFEVLGGGIQIARDVGEALRQMAGIASSQDFLDSLASNFERAGDRIDTELDQWRDAGIAVREFFGVDLTERQLERRLEALGDQIDETRAKLDVRLAAGLIDEAAQQEADALRAKLRDLAQQSVETTAKLDVLAQDREIQLQVGTMREELEGVNAQIVDNQKQLDALLKDGVTAVEQGAVATLEAKIAELKEQASRMEAAAADLAGGIAVGPATAPVGGVPEQGAEESTRAAFAERFRQISTEITSAQAKLESALAGMGETIDVTEQKAVDQIRGEIARLRADREALAGGLSAAIGEAVDLDPTVEQAQADLAQLNALIAQSVGELHALLADTTKRVDVAAKTSLERSIQELTGIRDAIREGLEEDTFGPPLPPVPQPRGAIPPSVARAGRAETLVADKEAELLFQARIEGLGEVDREIEEFKRTLEQSDVDVGDVDLGPIRAAAAELAGARREAEPAPVADYIAGLQEELALTQASAAERAQLEGLIRAENAAKAEGRALTQAEREEVERVSAAIGEATAAAQFEGLIAGLEEEARLTGAVADQRGIIRSLIEAENAAKEAGRSLTLGELALLEEKHARIDLIRVQQAAAADQARQTEQRQEDLAGGGRGHRPVSGGVEEFGQALFGGTDPALAQLDEQAAAWENMASRVDNSLASAGAAILTFQVGMDDLDDFVLSTLQSIAQSFVQAGLQQAIMGFTNLLLGGFTGAPTGTMVPGPMISTGTGTFQEGGPFKGGQVLRVGEIRPETVVTFPGGGGLVIPYASGGAFGEAKRRVGDPLIADEAMRAVMPFASGGAFGEARRKGADRLWTGADEEVLEAIAPFAAGGRFTGGQTLRVGESGPETIFTLPGGGGFVVPYATTVMPFQGGGAFGGVTVPPEMLKPAEVVLPPDVAREIAVATGEAIKQQRGDERGGVTVNVHDRRGGGGPPVEVRSGRGPDGRETIDVMVLDSMSRLARTGETDALFSRYGGRRVPDA